jgi:hypothetical protein
MNANASFSDQPFLYHSLDTSNFNFSRMYNADDQVSWGILQQLIEGVPVATSEFKETWC